MTFVCKNNNWVSAWDFQQFGMCDQQSLRPACAYAQSDQSLCLSLEYSMIVKLLTERHLEFLSITGGCRGPSESTLVKMSNCWKSRALAQFIMAVTCTLPGNLNLWRLKVTKYSRITPSQLLRKSSKIVIEPRHVISNNVVFWQV